MSDIIFVRLLTRAAEWETKRPIAGARAARTTRLLAPIRSVR